MILSFRRHHIGWPFVIMWLLVRSYDLPLELQYKPQLHITVFPPLPKKCCPKARLHEVRWSLKSYCTSTCIKNWVFRIILNNILFLDMALYFKFEWDAKTPSITFLFSQAVFILWQDNHHKPIYLFWGTSSAKYIQNRHPVVQDTL